MMAQKHIKEDDEGYEPKTVRLPIELWKIIEKDAKRCKRSFTKQVEAILTEYYEQGDTGLLDMSNMTPPGGRNPNLPITPVSKPSTQPAQLRQVSRDKK